MRAGIEAEDWNVSTREDLQSHLLKTSGISIPICSINDQINGNGKFLAGGLLYGMMGMENSAIGGVLYHYMG